MQRTTCQQGRQQQGPRVTRARVRCAPSSSAVARSRGGAIPWLANASAPHCCSALSRDLNTDSSSICRSGSFVGRVISALALSLLATAGPFAARPPPAAAAASFAAAAAAAASASEGDEETLSNVPGQLGASGADAERAQPLSRLMAGENKKGIESCTRKCVPTCVRGGGGERAAARTGSMHCHATRARCALMVSANVVWHGKARPCALSPLWRPNHACLSTFATCQARPASAPSACAASPAASCSRTSTARAATACQSAQTCARRPSTRRRRRPRPARRRRGDARSPVCTAPLLRFHSLRGLSCCYLWPF